MTGSAREPGSISRLTAAREPGNSDEWNAGYDAAVIAVIRIVVERSFTH
jgi:hypothetical protein